MFRAQHPPQHLSLFCWNIEDLFGEQPKLSGTNPMIQSQSWPITLPKTQVTSFTFMSLIENSVSALFITTQCWTALWHRAHYEMCLEVIVVAHLIVVTLQCTRTWTDIPNETCSFIEILWYFLNSNSAWKQVLTQSLLPVGHSITFSGQLIVVKPQWIFYRKWSTTVTVIV